MLGCSEGDRGITPATPGAISFGNVSTRVDSASEIDEFSVWATVSSITDGAVNPDVSYVPILTNERVYRNPAGSNNWTYDNTQNWISNSYFHFFAAYPRTVNVQELRIDNGGNGPMTGYILPVVANGSADTEDILVATNMTNTSVEGYATTVPLSFSHLLSKMNLTVSQNTDIDGEFEYYVSKVTITGLVGNNTFMVAPYNGSFAMSWLGDFEMPDDSLGITPPSPITLVADFTTPVCLRRWNGNARESNPLKVWGENGVMLVPQNISANGVKIRVDYLYDTNPNDTDLGEAKFVEGYIPAITWQSNTAINYNIAIANTSNIVFNQPSIIPWGSPNTGGTVIIK